MNICWCSDRRAHCWAEGVNHLNTRTGQSFCACVGMGPEVLVVCVLRDKMIVGAAGGAVIARDSFIKSLQLDNGGFFFRPCTPRG